MNIKESIKRIQQLERELKTLKNNILEEPELFKSENSSELNLSKDEGEIFKSIILYGLASRDENVSFKAKQALSFHVGPTILHGLNIVQRECKESQDKFKDYGSQIPISVYFDE